MGLEGKTAIVTGGAQGIGKAIAMRLARDGANIGILDLQQEAAAKTAEQARALGIEAVPLACDVTDYAKVKTCVAALKDALGTIDILINNAGIDISKVFVHTDESIWNKIIDVNYRSFLNASHACIPYMIEQKKRKHRESPAPMRDESEIPARSCTAAPKPPLWPVQRPWPRNWPAITSGSTPSAPGRFIRNFGISSMTAKREKK